jgi:hypothetical protein
MKERHVASCWACVYPLLNQLLYQLQGLFYYIFKLIQIQVDEKEARFDGKRKEIGSVRTAHSLRRYSGIQKKE